MSDIHNQREIENMQAEIDRLRQILENIQQARVLQGKATIDANNEIDRLRAALREIIRLDDEWFPETQDDYTYDGYQKCADIARAALEGK